MRAATTPVVVFGSTAVVLSIAIGGCDKLARKHPGEVRAQAKRQQAACASASANDRLKNSMFDEAIARRNGDRANLDVLADYSVARMQDPVVQGWDASLDITRCKGRFILEVPPGAERALAGERQLQADIEYTAQASADGAGFVYQQKGAEPIIAKLAAFNLGPVAYRPSPAIDAPDGEESEQTSIPKSQASGATAKQPASVRPTPQPAPLPPLTRASRPPIADRSSKAATSSARMSTPSGSGEATVRAFYAALGAGNGAAASSQIIPEKRSTGPFSPGAISRFYGRLREPLKLTGVVPLTGGKYQVRYRYSAGRSRCNGSAIVTLTSRGGRDLIRAIRALSGC